MRMKKLLLLLVLVITSVTAFADNTTCRVYGIDNVATLENTSDVANEIGRGTPFVTVSVALTKEATENVAVVVEVKDNVGNVIANGVLTISKGFYGETRNIYSEALERGKTYYLSIASASCQ